MSTGRTAWTVIGVVCVLCIGARLLNSKEPTADKPKASMNLLNSQAPKPTQPGPVGRYMPHPSPALGIGAMDTTNGQLWVFNGDAWLKKGMPIPEQNAPVVITPDPTGKVRPKPEADFNKEPGPPVELRRKLEETDPTEKPLPKAVPKPPKLQ